MADPLRMPSSDPWREALARLGQGPELLAVAHTLAGIPPGLDATGRRDLALVALLLLLAQQDGHTRLPLAGPGADLTQARLELFAPGLDLATLLSRPALAVALGTPGGPPRPFLRTAEGLASARLHAAEGRLAVVLRARSGLPDSTAAVDLGGLLDRPVSLSEEQREAVRRAVGAPLTLITGGPGTGKTSIVVALLRAALRAGLAPEDMALAAPTGKAAQRLGESLRATLGRLDAPGEGDCRLREALPEPQTLHRLLAFLPSRSTFRHHRANPLPHRLVVVDEGSMVSLELMDGLLAALRPDARLVLLGDAEQLPSVEPGAVFRDLVAGLPEAACRLTHSYRMDAADPAGRSVLGAARALRAGDAAALEAPGGLAGRASLSALKGLGAEFAEPSDGELRAFLADFQAREILVHPGVREAAERVYGDGDGLMEGDAAALERLFQAHERVQVLCPLKDAPGLRSVAGLNLAFHRFAAREAGALDRDLGVYAGEPVMVTVNDYRRGLFNGDLGLVVKARQAEGIHQAVAFRAEGGFRLLPHRPLAGQLEPAWALTVHKAQGSEFDRVVLVLPPPDSPLLTREVLYTALTRARKGATILGSREALEAGLSRTSPRHTGLQAALRP
jgi:exodeoxyribonuclease V alpha subunit